MKNFKLFTRAIIENDNGKVLLIRHGRGGEVAAGKTLLPGGKINFGETPKEALKREVFEEVGLEIISFIEIVETPMMMIGETHWLGIYYKVKTKNLDFKNMEPEKHEEVFWGDKNQIQ